MGIEVLKEVSDVALLDELIDRISEKLQSPNGPSWEHVLADLSEARCNPVWDI